MPDVSSVSHTPEGGDSAQADITSPAADTQSVPVNSPSAADESEPLAPAVTANAAPSVKPAGKKKGYRSTVTPPQEVLDALESFPPHIRGQLINNVLKYSDHRRCVDILRSDDVGIAISDAEKQALLDGYAVEIETAPQWALYVCEDIGLPLSAKEATPAEA